MPTNEIEQNWKKWEESLVGTLLQAKAKWVHACLAAILPPELYALAAGDNQLERCQKWAKEQGYRWLSGPGIDRLMRGPACIAEFRPKLVGEGQDRHCEIYARVGPNIIQVVDEELLKN